VLSERIVKMRHSDSNLSDWCMQKKYTLILTFLMHIFNVFDENRDHNIDPNHTEDFNCRFRAKWSDRVLLVIRVTRGRCYDHNFLQFLQIFGEILAFFSKSNVMVKNLHNLALFWVKNAIFCNFLRRNYLINHIIGPRLGEISPIWLLCTLGSFMKIQK
jgi:hypothetical protein